MEEFKQKPTESRNNHIAYTDSFLNFNTSPEYAIGEVMLSSLYRNVGWKNSETGNKFAESLIFKYGSLTEGILKRIEKNKREDGDSKIFDYKDFDKILQSFLQSPRTAKQLNSKNLILYPIISDTAIYSSAARMKGNPWNPGSLIEDVIVCGCKDISEASEVWNNLYIALNSNPENEKEDIWARILAKEFSSWRDNSITWGNSPNQLSKPSFIFYQCKNSDKFYPARQFVNDLKLVIALKDRLTRKQWISIVESLIRVGSASHLLWVCKVNSIIWEYFMNTLRGIKVTKRDLEGKIFNKNIIDLKYGENINIAIKKYAREYIIARVGINFLLYKLGDLAPKKINSLDEVESLAQILLSKNENFDISEINLEINNMLEKDPKLLNCTKGIGNNIYEFIRYSLGQKMTADVTRKSFDQGFWLKKKGEYSSAPWLLEMGPVSILLLVYCETEPYNFSRTINNFCEHLSNYGISMNPNDIASSKIANTLRSLGLVTDSPDAEGGMVINNPFKI